MKIFIRTKSYPATPIGNRDLNKIIFVLSSESARSSARLLLWLAWNSLPDRQSPGSRCYYRQLQALVENVFVFSVYTSAINALDMLRRCALHIYILLTYLLTYLMGMNYGPPFMINFIHQAVDKCNETNTGK